MKNWNRMQNAAALWGYFIDVTNMHDCNMKFDYVRISLTREKYWYEIRDVLVPFLHALWGIGTNSSRREINEVWNLRFNRAGSQLAVYRKINGIFLQYLFVCVEV